MQTRTPALIGMGFASLESLAPGRVWAGLGVSSPLVVEGWHGRTFDRKSLAYVREFIPQLRQALDRERMESGFRLTLHLENRVPIVLAAMRPKMIQLAGEIADGVLLTWCPPGEAPARVALAREAAERAGRDPDELLVAITYFAYSGPDTEEALERLRRFVTQYATVPTHRESFRGAIPHLDDLGEAWARGDRKAALAMVDDDAVRAICAVGSAEAVAERGREFAAAGVDLPIMVVVGARVGDSDGPMATIESVGAVADLTS
jgi:alkanesulfonate monooxygenase SsuD/methylene tetrahydromethanopterin reductase-like flavin-dependent oxidoreductase (luciferase family)